MVFENSEFLSIVAGHPWQAESGGGGSAAGQLLDAV